MATPSLTNSPDDKSVAPGFMKSLAVREFWVHTSQLAFENGMAKVIDFDLMNIHRLAPYIILCDVDYERCRHKLRFVGTKAVELFGGETTGQFLDEINLGPYRSQQLAAFNMAVASGCPQWTQSCVIAAEKNRGELAMKRPGRSEDSYERLIVPLAGAGSTIIQLAAITYASEIPCDSNTFEHQEISTQQTRFSA
ncbi:hypothetical protein L2D14_07750 [Thalassospiraceae bacterium LMO-JJ14]|nr:hypothetical protein L2D14_07750 [Thalassospiraceae bacterium LMO-JJ14]